ncbi:MAG TPA: acyl-CoA thioesterase [Bryobacteraceae bacterium]|nr:acyl-CoA thioesterase [Bryobacteraceae bacterium]
MTGKPVRESVSEYAQLALPTDANNFGNVLGGAIMHLVDVAGAMAAMRHARKPVVTASVDSFQFLHPVHIGHLIILRSSVNRVFRTSMEAGVYVEAENLVTGERVHTCSAYLTFVALDRDGRATPVEPVVPETADQERRYRQAGQRRESRLDLRNRMKAGNPDRAPLTSSTPTPASPPGTPSSHRA